MFSQPKYFKFIFFLLLAFVLLVGAIFIFPKKEIEEEEYKFKHLSSDIDLNIQPIIFSNEENRKIYGAIIPHHLVADSIIVKTLGRVASYFDNKDQKISQIVLLSPNHFLTGKEYIITSDGDWQTKFGILESDDELVEKLRLYNYAGIEYEAIEREHGISSLLPFIKYFYPEAKIVPLMIEECLGQEDLEKIALFFQENLTENSLMIVSADFSHYLPKEIADFHDKASIAALYNFDFDFLEKMDVDTPSSLSILLKYLALKNSQRFVLVENANSLDVIEGNYAEETTSYVSGYFTEGEQDFKKQITLLAFGDLMLDRNVFLKTQKAGDFAFPFININLFLKGADFRLANLEGPITKFESVATRDNRMRFTFSLRFLEELKKRFDIFSLANNHTLDFGEDGLKQTKDFLAQEEIGFFGDFKNRKESISKVIEKNGIKIGFVGYHALVYKNLSEIIKEIQDIKNKSDFVIVFSHWGDEYQVMFSSSQQEEARMFIDAGADLILGSHPHVIQPIEIYKNKVIFYSLGNFIFDQYFSQETMEGLSVGILLEKSYNKIKASYSLFPFIISGKSQPKLAGLEKRLEILSELSNNSIISENGYVKTK